MVASFSLLVDSIDVDVAKNVVDDVIVAEVVDVVVEAVEVVELVVLVVLVVVVFAQ